MKNDLTYLDDAMQFIDDISSRISQVSKEEFLANANLQDSITLKIIYIGEALGRVSNEFREANTELPWRNAIGMRNRLAHDYGNVNLNDVWVAATVNLPELRITITKILGANHA
jgi:uncharacterized protein with HEPN domain